jgi:hypothetical protein
VLPSASAGGHRPSSAGDFLFAFLLIGVSASLIAMLAIMVGGVLYGGGRELYLRGRYKRAARRGDPAAAEILESRWVRGEEWATEAWHRARRETDMR